MKIYFKNTLKPKIINKSIPLRSSVIKTSAIISASSLGTSSRKNTSLIKLSRVLASTYAISSYNNQNGIELSYSNDNTVSGNTAMYNLYYGIYLATSSYNNGDAYGPYYEGTDCSDNDIGYIE